MTGWVAIHLSAAVALLPYTLLQSPHRFDLLVAGHLIPIVIHRYSRDAAGKQRFCSPRRLVSLTRRFLMLVAWRRSFLPH